MKAEDELVVALLKSIDQRLAKIGDLLEAMTAGVPIASEQVSGAEAKQRREIFDLASKALPGST